MYRIFSFSEKYLKNKGEEKIAKAIFIIFLLIYILLGVCLSYNYDFSEQYDLLFDSDTPRVIEDMSNIYGNHYRIKVHPLFVLLVQPLVLLINGITMNKMLAMIVFLSIVTALSITIMYKFASLFIEEENIKILIISIFGFSFANIIFTAGIELYNIAALFLIILWYIIAKILLGKIKVNENINYLLILGILSISITVTNFFVFTIAILIIFLSKKIDFTECFCITVTAISFAIILSIYQNLVWHNTPIILNFTNNYTEEQLYMTETVSEQNLNNVLKNNFLNSLIASKIEYNEKTEIIEFTDLLIFPSLTAIAWYLIVAWHSIKNFDKNKLLNIGIILTLLFNIILHLVYGNNSCYLYSLHFLYLSFILFIINYKKNKKEKINCCLKSVLILIFIFEVVINIKSFNKVVNIVSQILAGNYYVSNFSTLSLAMIIALTIILTGLFIYLIYRNIKNIGKSNNRILNVVYILIFIILIQTIFIGIDTTAKYNNFFGITISEPKIKRDLIEYFNVEYDSYLKYKKEYENFITDYNVEKNLTLKEANYYFFGMGNRPKIIFNKNKLIDIETNETFFEWNVKDYLIIPNEYCVILQSIDDTFIKIYENENGIYITKNKKIELLIENTNVKINLEKFENQKYSNIKKVLYNEILFNIKNGKPIPNIFVYEEVFYRDAAMCAMVLNQTNNMNLIEGFIDEIHEIYDYQNEELAEPDNLGELLYIISLSQNEHKELIDKILEEADKIASKNKEGYFITGKTDFVEHQIYQNKWYQFGIKSLNLNTEIKEVDNYTDQDSYEPLVWFYENNRSNFYDSNQNEKYPYLAWAQFHSLKKGKVFIGNTLYPLSYEQDASQADYSKMKILGEYYENNKISPTHLWTASEILLFLLDETGDFSTN